MPPGPGGVVDAVLAVRIVGRLQRNAGPDPRRIDDVQGLAEDPVMRPERVAPSGPIGPPKGWRGQGQDQHEDRRDRYLRPLHDPLPESASVSLRRRAANLSGMKVSRAAAFLILLALVGCGADSEPATGGADDATTTSQATQETAADDEASPLAGVCKKAFALIDNSEPGTVPRKKAVALANEAFFIDDAPETNEAFSNLNNVYVYDDGSSSPEEVRSQLEHVCA